MLPTLIQKYDKKIISFLIQFKKERLIEILGCQMPHFMIVSILYINLLNLSWIKNVYILRNIEPLISISLQFLILYGENAVAFIALDKRCFWRVPTTVYVFVK